MPPSVEIRFGGIGGSDMFDCRNSESTDRETFIFKERSNASTVERFLFDFSINIGLRVCPEHLLSDRVSPAEALSGGLVTEFASVRSDTNSLFSACLTPFGPLRR
jgi:hypothetical protein